jgi:hypothetical protein
MRTDDRTNSRRQILRLFGATDETIDELLLYNENVFDRTGVQAASLPLSDEPFVAAWEDYLREVESAGDILPLQKYLVQLRFPVRRGMSTDPEYLAAIKSGQGTGKSSQDALQLRSPELCRLVLHKTAAGRIPLLIAPVREDFELLVQALSKRNEPAYIPASMGACMIAGYRNWDRIRQVANVPPGEDFSDRLLDPAVQERLKDKSSYQDRFIVLSSGFYSGVPAAELGLEEQAWTESSIAIRREHECTHYFTRRVFSSMRNNLIDEIIADYCGIVAALGYFVSDWMLTFFGLENFPLYRAGARLENYRGTPPLSEPAFGTLQKLVKHTAENLVVFERAEASGCSATASGRLATLLTLSRFTLEELACADAPSRIRAAFHDEQEGIFNKSTFSERTGIATERNERRNGQCAEYFT